MNKNSSFKKKLIATAIGSYALAGISGAAMAQDDGTILEEVVVTGILGSLNRAMDIKRDSQGVVDAIAAEDIGKFPDTNLAESLQRITGVSIDRANGEGSRVTVRGFGPDYNLVTLNGRQMPTSALEDTGAAATRSFDFANLAAEGISGVEVYKTSRASIPTGGIGATINVLTHRPLDNPGLNASIGIKGVIDESTSRGADITPEISGIYSNSFADDTFGISISGSYQERESGSRMAGVSDGWHTFPGWVDQDWDGGTADWGGIPQEGHENRPGPDDIYSVPQQLAYTFNEVQRTRTNGQLALQYRPIDTLTATLDYTYSKLEVAQQFNDVSAWFNFGPSTGVWTDGPISSPLVYAEQTYGTPSDLAMGAGNFARVNENNSVGINVEWLVNDRLTLELDAHSSDAESRPDSPYGSHNAFGVATFVRAETIADFSNDFPVLQIIYPEGQEAIDPSDIRIAGSSFRNSMMRSEIDQVHLSGNLVFDGGQSIDFGVMHTDVHNRSAYTNVQRDSWGGVGEAGDFDDDFWVRQTIGDRFNFAGSDSPDLLSEFYSFDFAEAVARSAELYPYDGGVTGDCGNHFCPSTDYANQTDRYTREETFSAYFQFNMDFDLYDMPVNVATGLRYESTDVTSSAAVPTYSGVAWTAANEFSLRTTGEQDYTELTGGYSKLMPSIDANIEIVEDVIVRASISESLARPSYSAIQGGTTVSQLARINGGTGSRGNPDLLPYESLNLDLSVEWYYDYASYVSAGWFRKDVKNFIGSSIVQEELFGLAHPGDGPRYQEAQAEVGDDAVAIRDYIIANYGDTEYVSGNNIFGIPGEDNIMSFDVTVPVNERDAAVYGWELAAQHMFGDSGFGVIANLTLVESRAQFDDLTLDEQYPLFGLSDSANLIGFYDRDGLQARLAYNWRDKFIAAGGHGTGYPNPVYVEAYGQFDLSVSYDVTSQLTVFAEGINITDEYTRTHSRAPEQLMNVTQLGPRYNLGLRYTF